MTTMNFITKKAGYIGGLMLSCGAILLAPSAYAQTSNSNRVITSQDIYENPDDHQLNLNYAKQEIQIGELLNSASALERMLYANPNWHSARLLYAAVLYRLDDPKAALRELSLLEGREMNNSQIETYERYLAEFQTPLPARTETELDAIYTPHDAVKATFSLGLRGDDNAGNALTDEGFGFDDRQGDVSLNLRGRVALTGELTDAKRIAPYAIIGGQIRRHETFSQADYDLIDVQVGFRGKPSAKNKLSVGIDARQIDISGEKYLEQIGPRISIIQDISSKTKARASVSYYHQDYHVLRNAPLEDERDGFRTRLQLGFQSQLKPTQKATLVFGYDIKTADIDAFAYDGPQALFAFENKFKNKIYSRTQAQIRFLNYDGSLDPEIDERDDTRIAIRQAIGVPINVPIGKTAAIEFGVNYNKRASNIDSNDFDNLGADVQLKINF